MSSRVRALFVTADHPFAGRAGSFVYSRSILGMLGGVAQVTVASLELTPGRNVPTGRFPTSCAPGEVLGGGKLASLLKSVFVRESMVETQFNQGRALAWINSRLEELQPDLVVFNHLRCAWLVPHLPGHWRQRSVYLAHNAEGVAYRSVASLQSNLLMRKLVSHGARKIEALEERVAAAAASIWCISAQDGQRLSRLGGRDIHVIPPAAEAYPPQDRPDPDRLLLVGSFNWQAKRRNAIWLVEEVWPDFRREFPQWELRIVGAGATRLGHRVMSAPGVSVFADVDSVDPFFRDGGVFVVPERQQGGVKLKTLEAASWGLPVVSTPEGVEGTPLQHGESCMVAGDTADFVAALKQLATDPAGGRAMGEAARARVAAAHSTSMVQECFDRAAARWLAGEPR